MSSLNVLILAAGLGTRLRPLTLQLPKPLVPVVDDSILAHQARFARSLGNVHLHINAHYLANKIEREAEKLQFTKVWREQELLGTGGPIYRMAKEGYGDELLVLNGDCYCALDLKRFVENARNSGAPVVLLVRDFPAVNTLLVAGQKLSGIVGRFGENEKSEMLKKTTFSGIAWYSADALRMIDASEKDVRVFWQRLWQKGMAPSIEFAENNALWIDMGTPLGLYNAVAARLKELRLPYWVNSSFKERNEKILDKVTIQQGTVIHEGVSVSEGATLNSSVLYSGACVLPGEMCAREIRGADFCWKV